MNFNERATNLLEMPVSPITWDGIIKEAQRLEREFAYIPSNVKWALDYKRFQVEHARGNASDALWYLKQAIATAPYNADILADYKKVVQKSSDLQNLVLIISSKVNESKALRLAEQFDAAGVQYMIVSGNNTPSIAHPRALQVEVADNFESTPRKVVAALTWVYENIGSNVGVLKVSDEMGLVDAAALKRNLAELYPVDAYAGVPTGGLEHDRCFHWGLCDNQELNRRVYSRPVLRTWAGGGALYLGPGPVEKVVSSLIRFPGLFDGEYYDDKLVGDVLVFEGVALVERAAYADFGLTIGGVPAPATATGLSLPQVSPAPAPAPAPAPVPAPAPAAVQPQQLPLKVQGAGTAAPAPAGKQALYLHLGCGTKNFPGFINIDLDAPGADMNLNLTKQLPWERGTVTGIYSEHFFEHVGANQGIRLLHECHRILKPGGIVRFAMPDLEYMIGDYVNNRVHPDWARFGMPWTASRCQRLNIAMRWWGHEWIYDEEELVRIGKMVGLELIGRCEYGVSSDPMLNDREYRESSQLIVEFRKPERQVQHGAEPLVSIVMPSYKATYFRQALESALAQTYRNIEVLVTDDCPTDAIAAIVRDYQERDARVRYMRNPKAGTDIGRSNHCLCLEQAKGEFVKFLNDDDVLAPHCVERLLGAFAANPDITLATSKRQRIDRNGSFLPDITATQLLVQEDSVIDGLSLGSALLSTQINFVGEPSTVMFRKSEVAEVKPDFMSVDGQEISWASDVAIYINLALKGSTAYLTEALSFFRIHEEQGQVVSAVAAQEESTRCWNILRDFWTRNEFHRPI